MYHFGSNARVIPPVAYLGPDAGTPLRPSRPVAPRGSAAGIRRRGRDRQTLRSGPGAGQWGTALAFEALGWVTHSEFAGSGGWSLTEAGRGEDRRRLAAELDAAGARPVVVDVHARFVPLNARFLDAATRWQVRPLPGQPMASNDHTDHRWDDRVLDDIGSVSRQLAPLEVEMSNELVRLGGYVTRYQDAFVRASRGEYRWVDALGTDSCHTVWMQLHEDLLATLGLQRGPEN